MKKHISLLSFVAATLVTLNTWAIPAIYMPNNSKEVLAVDTFRKKDDGSYKIWLNIDDHFTSRVVSRSELSFATFEAIDGNKDGQRALVMNSETQKLEHCKIDNVFENHTMNLFCDFFNKEGTIDRHYYNVISTAIVVPEIDGDIGGFTVGQNARINGEAIVGLRILGVGTRVKVRALFANGKILVQENPKFPEFAPNGPTGDADSILVNVSDLSR